MYQYPSSNNYHISRLEQKSKSSDAFQSASRFKPDFSIPPSSNKVLGGIETSSSFNVSSASAVTLGGSIDGLIEGVRILSDSEVVLQELNGFNVLNRIVEITH
jgi:hypothetical protein